VPQVLSDILAQLDPVYQPQKQAVQSQINALPGQQAADQAGLDAAKTKAFGDINVQANDRGLSYSGMPIAEQAKYTGATYLPAVANLKNTYANKGFALQGSLAGLGADEMKSAQGVVASETNAEVAAQQKQQALQQQMALEAYKANLSNQSNNAFASALGGASQAAAAPAAPTIQDHLNADIQNLIPADYASRFLPGYTERQITRLQGAYKELDPNAVKNAVYAYRKQVAGN
jgi:hypothetical protein